MRIEIDLSSLSLSLSPGNDLLDVLGPNDGWTLSGRRWWHLLLLSKGDLALIEWCRVWQKTLSWSLPPPHLSFSLDREMNFDGTPSRSNISAPWTGKKKSLSLFCPGIKRDFFSIAFGMQSPKSTLGLLTSQPCFTLSLVTWKREVFFLVFCCSSPLKGHATYFPFCLPRSTEGRKNEGGP